jgi:glutamate synthase domain-containing protein 1
VCGIVGLFLKDKSLVPELGAILSEMLVSLSDRGPDSAGVAIYRSSEPGKTRITVQSAAPDADFAALDVDLGRELGAPVEVAVNDTHAVLAFPGNRTAAVRAALREVRPSLRIMSAGERMEIYKEVGLPQAVVDRFSLRGMSGTHGIGHTRMATESAVTTLGAHPFSTGADQCLVHNGSLSNHNNVRRELKREGIAFETESDTEVAAAYVSSRLAAGQGLKATLLGCLEHLDGFFTFAVGTRSGFGVLRDPIACKPAVLAETDRYVAFGSEYRALAGLPAIAAARVWEPEPAEVYFWERRDDDCPDRIA